MLTSLGLGYLVFKMGWRMLPGEVRPLLLPKLPVCGHLASRGRWYKRLQVHGAGREQTGKAATQVGALAS